MKNWTLLQWGILVLVLCLVAASQIWMSRPNPGPVRRLLGKVGDGVEKVLTVVGTMFGVVFAIVLSLVALYVVIWIINRMWEAA